MLTPFLAACLPFPCSCGVFLMRPHLSYIVINLGGRACSQEPGPDNPAYQLSQVLFVPDPDHLLHTSLNTAPLFDPSGPPPLVVP